ncbi:hypothetical protein HPB48_000764 [Haemaphysalis longicornis]|uniref:Peptidase M13 N-terminal domain-containing protein n=1 Tax=Haemaphysalis longicornis TaxID=44386 RepID=A0A9J6GS65_HAELO|nr:hypothetical protein HPB48_000764 [Haemaphysalis longicornis]
MVRRWLDDFQWLLIKGAKHLTVGKKAKAMYDSCTASAPQPTKGALTAFMNATNLSWPEEPTNDVNAFGVLLDLAYNWNVPLWFRVVVLPEDAYHERRRILISLNPQVAQWQAILEQLGSVKTYMVYWTSFYNQLVSDADNKIPSDSAIVNSYRILKTVLGTFLKKDTYADEAPVQLSLDDAPKHVTFANNMTELVNEHVDYGCNFSPHDLLVFSEARLLQALNNTFARYSNAELLHHISWLFVQAHGPVVDPFNLLLSRHGSKSGAQEELPRYCASQVEASYPMMTNALCSVSQFSPRLRRFISDQLHNVAESVRLGIMRAPWLDPKSRTAAETKINWLRTVLWPPDTFLEEKSLAALYRLFPPNETSFSGFWLETRRALKRRRLQEPQYNSEPFDAPGSYALPLVTYEHALNTVFVAMAALTRPLFYSPEAGAMTYGGLGYQYARQVLRAIDSNGASLDRFGRPVETWLSPESAGGLQERAECYGVTDYNTLLDIAALEVAYNAFRAAPLKSQVNVFGDITPAKVFFISVCYASCSQKRLYSVEQCQKLVSGFRPFAEAFNCEKLLAPVRVNNCSVFY